MQGNAPDFVRLLLPSLASLVLGAWAHAQGTVNFANSATNRIPYAFPPGTPVPVGQFTVGLYYAPMTADGSPLPCSALTLIATTGIAPAPGRFLGGVVTTPATTAPGESAWFQIRVWQNTFASWESAFAGNGYVTCSDCFINATGGAGIPPGPAARLEFTAPPSGSSLASRRRSLAASFTPTEIHLSISGSLGVPHEVQEATSLVLGDWSTVRTLTLTCGTEVVALPVPAGRERFWRVRVPGG